MTTTEPRLDLDRCVCWCRACLVWANDDPAWAQRHQDEHPDHTVHRRTMRVETWEGTDA